MRNRRSGGFISFEVVIGVLVLISSMSFLSYWLNEDADRKVNSSAASNAQTVVDATQKWMGDNLTAIQAAANPYVAYDVSAIASYLPTGFVPTNAYQQSYSIRVNKVAGNRLETLIVTTGGEAISDKSLRQIGQLVGGQGGYISALSPNTATGSFGGWSYPMASYGGSPGAGKLALAVFFQDGMAVDSGAYLHRQAVAGRPEYNRMETAIDMNGNRIDNAGAVTAQSVALPAGNSVRVGNTFFYGDAQNTAVRSQVGGGFYVQDVNGNAADIKSAKDIYANTTQTNESYVNGWFRARNDAGLYWEKWGGGWYMSDPSWIRAYNGKNIWTSGTLQADGNVNSAYISAWGWMNSAGRLRTGEYLQIDGWAPEGGGCSPNGLQGRDGNGMPLFCQSGVWKRSGGSITPFRVDGGATCSWAPTSAVCPAGSRLVSGGYVLTWFNGSSFSHAPDASYPDAAGNQWVLNGSGTNSCFQAFASCTY